MKLLTWNNIKLNEIRKHAKESLKFKDFNANSRTKIYWLYLYLLPILFSLLLLSLGLFIEKEIAGYFVTSISIFAGLFFSLLFIVTDKYNSKKDKLNELIEQGDEETRNYLKRYKNFSIFLIRQISFTIILAISLILSLSVIYFYPQFPQIEWCSWRYVKLIGKCILNGVIYYWIMQFMIFLLVILSNMYIMLLDDINFEKNK
jgi:hypothetical protein